MIYEPKGLEYDTLWVDGFLPSNGQLAGILSNWQGREFIRSIDDRAIIEAVELKANSEYAASFRSITRPGGYLQMLKPMSHDFNPRRYNPIQSEFKSMITKKDQYRLFFMVSRDAIFPNSLKSSFLSTLNDLSFEIKPDSTYANNDGFKEYLKSLSDFFIQQYYIPFQLIKDNLNTLGFDSENRLVV